MSAAGKYQAEDESDDGFQYEEVSLEDDWSHLAEGEEDLEATVKAIKERSEASAAAPRAHAPPVDAFLRTFLLQMGMTDTLDCFQTEWTEMAHRGLVDTEQVGVVPDVYVVNQRLASELRNAQREVEEYRRAASAAAGTLGRVQKARDLHRLQHNRVVQEKNSLVEEIRKLKVRCDSYEHAVKRMNEKYQAVLKQTMLLSQEGEEAGGPAALHHLPLCGEPGVRGKTSPVIQPRPPTSANRSQTRVKGATFVLK